MTIRLKAGPELDEIVAILVMNWNRLCAYGEFKDAYYGHHGCLTQFKKDWKPSTDIAQAFKIVELLGKQSTVLTFGEDTGYWECSFIVGGRRDTGVGVTAAHAICLAALEAGKR